MLTIFRESAEHFLCRVGKATLGRGQLMGRKMASKQEKNI
jgi:hypothetical protein